MKIQFVVVRLGPVVQADSARVLPSKLLLELFTDIRSHIIKILIHLDSIFCYVDRYLLFFFIYTNVFYDESIAQRCFLPVFARVHIITFQLIDVIFPFLDLYFSLLKSAVEL
jgi:hypothetical protein